MVHHEICRSLYRILKVPAFLIALDKRVQSFRMPLLKSWVRTLWRVRQWCMAYRNLNSFYCRPIGNSTYFLLFGYRLLLALYQKKASELQSPPCNLYRHAHSCVQNLSVPIWVGIRICSNNRYFAGSADQRCVGFMGTCTWRERRRGNCDHWWWTSQLESKLTSNGLILRTESFSSLGTVASFAIMWPLDVHYW